MLKNIENRAIKRKNFNPIKKHSLRIKKKFCHEQKKKKKFVPLKNKMHCDFFSPQKKKIACETFFAKIKKFTSECSRVKRIIHRLNFFFTV